MANNIIFKGEFSNLNMPYINLNSNISLIGQNSNIINIPFVISANNIKIENLKITMNNQKEAFKFINAQNVGFFNNSITINSEKNSLTLSNSKLSIIDNIITINGDSPAILNDNGSYILFGENTINTLSELEILSLNNSIVKYTFYVVDDENYNEFFGSDGRFSDDCDIAIGDTLKITNLNNKTIRIDIPVVIKGFQASLLNNCTIILEDSASNTVLSNLRFKLENNNLDRDFSFIIIKDGVSNLIIANNQFNVSNIGGDHRLSAINLIGSEYSAVKNTISDNIFNLNADLDSIIAINVLNRELTNYEDITNNLSILNNNISITNNCEDGLSNGINLVNSNNPKINSNNIYVMGDNAFGLYLNKVSNSNIADNTVML